MQSRLWLESDLDGGGEIGIMCKIDPRGESATDRHRRGERKRERRERRESEIMKRISFFFLSINVHVALSSQRLKRLFRRRSFDLKTFLI